MSKEEPNTQLAKAHAVQKWCLTSESARGINAMLDLARSEPGIPVRPHELDCDPWLLNCPNGTLDLRTGKLREHRREDMITQLCPTEYHPNAPCPRWLRFLDEVFDQKRDLVNYVQRLLGYCLSGDVSEHILPVPWGDGSNGKGTLLNTFLYVLGGDYGMAAMPDLLLSRHGERHPTELADLFRKRLVVCQETGEGRRLNEPLVKWLTGGDKLRARRMREDAWEFDPTHKVFLITNYKPKIRGTDLGIWRRLRLIPFTVIFGDDRKDPALPEKLKTEAQGILAWCVRGCLDWQKGGMETPAEVLVATELYRSEEDAVANFLAEYCLISPQVRCRASVLYAPFRKWQEQGGEPQLMTQKAFGDALTRKGFKRTTSNGVWYCGLTLREGDQHKLE